MKIISKHKDFYDSAGFIDPSIIFVRKQEEVFLDIPNPAPYTSASGLGVIGLCGKFYPYIHRAYESYVDKRTGITVPEKHFYFYSIEAFMASDFWKSENSYRWRQKNLENSYRNSFSNWKSSDEPFITVDAPYFRMKSFTYHNARGVAITNPSLIDMQFGKVMDAPSIFQSVQFYLTNQLVKTKDPDEIEDKYKISGHGFDEHSFRHPTKLKDLK